MNYTEEDHAVIMQPGWEPTCKLRWFNPNPYEGQPKLQQAWVNQYGVTEWRDVSTEE